MATEIVEDPSESEPFPGVNVPIVDLDGDLWEQTRLVATPNRMWAHNLFGMIKGSRPWIATARFNPEMRTGWTAVGYWSFTGGRHYQVPFDVTSGTAFVEGITLLGARRNRHWKGYADKFVFWVIIEAHPQSLRVLRLPSIASNLPHIVERALAGSQPLTPDELQQGEDMYQQFRFALQNLPPHVQRHVLHRLVSE